MEIKLPKAQSKKSAFVEADFQALVTPYMKKYAWASFPYELKISSGKTVAFNAFRPQQLPDLWKAYSGRLHYKMSDASVGAKPCDGFVFYKSEAYVGLMFDVPKNRSVCYFVDIAVVMAIKRKGYKSITETMAKKLGIEINLCSSLK